MFKMNKKIKGSKNLNVPNKGEQSQTCLSYADRAEHLRKENVPNLRFPEFSGEWEKTTIGKILTIGNGRDYKHLTEGNIPVFGTGGYMLSVNEYLYDGESVFIGRKGTINKPFFFSGKFWTVDTLFYTHKFVDVLPYFVYGLFQRINWNNYNEASGVPSLSKSTIEKISINVPIVEEQRKIANLMSLLDDRIATQIKIIEDLKKLKSAISNEIFNHTSNRKCELKEIASVIMGQSPSSHAYNNNADGLPLIQGNLDIENGQLSPRIYTSEITQTCECGDVILTVRAPVGEIAIAQQEACIGRGVCSIRPHVNNDTNIIYQFLQYFKPKWGSLEQGSTFTAVSGTDIRGIAVSIPSADKIELLNVYDNKIRVESRILTNLTQQKQYLLAQMFI